MAYYVQTSCIMITQVLVVEASKISTLLDKLCTIVFQKSFKKYGKREIDNVPEEQRFFQMPVISRNFAQVQKKAE